MACAAPGKETDLNPFSLIEDASFNWSATVRRDNPADQLALTAEVSLEKIGGDLRKAMREARLILRDVGPECYGRLQVDEAGQPLLSREITSGGSWKAPGPGGDLPAFAGMDCEMIAGLIAEYGPEGSRHPAVADRQGTRIRGQHTGNAGQPACSGEADIQLNSCSGFNCLLITAPRYPVPHHPQARRWRWLKRHSA